MTIRSAIQLATDVEGPRLMLTTTVGDRYRVRISEDGQAGRVVAKGMIRGWR